MSQINLGTHAQNTWCPGCGNFSILNGIKSVLNELKKHGYPERLMYPTGWGEIYQLDTSGSSQGKAVNRRVDILIDPAASGLFTISAITEVAPTAEPAPGEGAGPVTATE